MNKNRRHSVLSSPYVWAFTTYFAEGFPYTVIRTLSSLFLRDMNVRLESIGLTSLFGLPWILKFLWGPQVDRFSTKRSWMLTCQFLLVGMMMLTAAFAPFSWGVSAIVLLFFAGSFIAATHDTAIDGFYMEALDSEGQAKFVGYRVMAYRIAMMTGTGVVATIGTTLGWPLAFFCAALMLGLVFVYHFFFLIRVEQPGRPAGELVKSALRLKNLALVTGAALLVLGLRSFLASRSYALVREQYPVLQKISFPHWVGLFLLLSLIGLLMLRKQIWARIAGKPDTFYARAFITFTDREKIGTIFAVIILMRTGEFLLTAMVSPFFVDVGIKVHYGWLSSVVGLPLSIAGALVGGFAISTFSLKKVIWPFLLLQNLTNLVYMVLALHLDPFVAINTGAAVAQPVGALNLFWVAVVHGFDQFAGGLGTAVLMTFLMRICAKEFKAAHYAIGTGLMNVSGLFAGILSGFLAGWLGYGYFFGISFLLSVPGMIAVLFLPGDIYNEPPKPAAGKPVPKN